MKSKLIFILWLLMFSFFSCDFGIKENEETNSKEYFTVKGSCSIQGAIPSDLFPEKSIKQNAQRTVVPEIGRTYEITVSFESETGETKTAEVVNNDGVLNFEIELPAGKWTVKAQGKKSDVVIIKSESCQIELSAENKSANVALVLKPTQSDTGRGYFKFSFGENHYTVSGMKYTYKKNGATEPQPAIINNFSEQNINLSSGVYTFRFDFYSDMECKDKLLYSFTEVVNIFDGLTTDTWIGAGEYINDEGEICITDDMISQFISTTVYVDKNGNDSNLGTFFAPVRTIQKAVDKVITMNEVTVSNEENPYKIFLLSDIISDDSFESNNNALVNINPSSASGNPLYLTISNYGVGNATINANRTDSNTGRVMYIGEKANVTLQNLILTGGHLNNDENNENEKGAGLYILNNDAIVKIENSEISSNVIDNGSGAGLHVGYNQVGGNLNLTIENSTISSNTINHKDTVGSYSGAGIAIENEEVTLTITNSEISENVIDQKDVEAGTPEDKGVGLWLGNCAVTTISDSTISKNIIENAASTNNNAGGGVYLKGGTLKIQNSTEKNTVISSNISGYGNGVYVGDGTFTMNDGAVISSDNDVYLADGTTITVTENLTSKDTVATITPENYELGIQVLKAESGVTLKKYPGNFAVTTHALSDEPENWFIDSAGYLVGGSVTEPSKSENEEFEVSSLENLLWIALELKKGNITSLNMKLTNNIDIQSGEWQFYQLNVPDHSTIDGQGHSITIKEDVSKFGNNAGGLFYKCNLSTVKNLVLKGSITANKSAGEYIGALCRSAWRTTIQNVMSTVTVQDNGSGNAGGLVGYFGGNNRVDDGNFTPDTFIKNCAVYANISSKNGTAGGLVGESWANEQTWRIKNCIYKGTVSSDFGYAGALIGNENTGKTSYLTNIWYCEPNNRDIYGKIGNGGKEIEVSEVNRKSETEIASEGAADLLNTDLDETDNYVWVNDPESGYPTLSLKTRSSE